jgi:choline dehydrogenase-like flavoprotein
MRTVQTDFLIVGSGFGAAAPALRLAEAGHRVTLVEKGPHIDPLRDFRMTQDPHYLTRYLKCLPGEHLGLTYAEALGGGSGFYEMVSLRAPSVAFDQVDQNGRRLWPADVDRTALDPHYDTADAMLRVEQIAPHEVPRNGLLFAQMMRNLEYSCERAPYAVRNCMGAGYCVTGCVFGAKQSLLLNYLPQAVAAGVTVETDLEALGIETRCRVEETPASGPLAGLPYRYAVYCRRTTGAEDLVSFEAKVVILAAGTVGTARLLLRSRPQLPRLSEQVGCNVGFNGSVKVAGIMPDAMPEGDLYAGRSHAGMISYEFLPSHGISIAAVKPLPLQILTSARLTLEGQPSSAYWGAANTELLRRFRHRAMVLVALGMTPPVGRIVADGDRFTAGLDLDDGLRRYYAETREIMHSILRRNGCRIVDAAFVDRNGAPYPDVHFSTAHQVGSCRMATSKRHGVVDPDGAVFDYPGLFISDGSTIPTSLAVNTAHTILANAERIAEKIRARCAERPEAVVAVD